jgi:S-adenosylmethionine:tRNA ribosyltransferase-isomerase
MACWAALAGFLRAGAASVGAAGREASCSDMARIVEHLGWATMRTPCSNPDALTVAHQLSDYDFDLDERLIAQHPSPQRSGSRLLDGSGAQAVDRRFVDLPELLAPEDLLVFNNTRVIHARLLGQKPSGGQVEVMVERVLCDENGNNNEVIAHFKASRKPEIGSVLYMAGHRPDAPEQGFQATLLGRWPDEQGALFRFRMDGDAYALMARWGHVPLPPYIHHSDNAEDAERYQTIFAQHPGAVAAPTAALHFDQALMTRLAARGVATAEVTLHVGAGTFAPVKVERIEDHRMHSEWYNIPAETLAAIQSCRARGGRVVAVGTTTVRTLESWARSQNTQGDTNIFITPGFEFQVVDALITNFHLPKSTLLMLVAAFTGYPHMRSLYAHAIAQSYRFFSYGDAMWLTRR